MALASGGGAEVATRAWGFLRVLSSFSSSTSSAAAVSSSSSWRWRPLSTTATTTTTASTSAVDGGGEESEKRRKKRRKKKNLFEVAQFLPNWGIGYLMAKNHWNGTSYKITKINLYKDGRHGKAWGVFHKDGLPSAEGPKKISGVNKRGWKYISETKMQQDSVADTVEKSSE